MTTLALAKLPGLLPGRGALDARGVSGLLQRALFGLEPLIALALAIHPLRVTISAARGHRAPARAKATG